MKTKPDVDFSTSPARACVLDAENGTVSFPLLFLLPWVKAAGFRWTRFDARSYVLEIDCARYFR